MDMIGVEDWRKVLRKSSILHSLINSQLPKLLPLFLKIKSANFTWPIIDAINTKKDAADL